MIWTIVLISTGVLGIYLAGRTHLTVRLAGWWLYIINELLWLAYARSIHSTALAVMACIWFVVGTLNIRSTYREIRRAGQ